MNQTLRVIELFTGTGSVRLIEGLDGGPLWVANDVARLAGYRVPRDAVRDFCADRRPLGQIGLSVEPGAQVIGTAGVMALLVHSRAPQAKVLAEWFRQVGFRVAAAPGPFDSAAPANEGADQVAVVPPSDPAPAPVVPVVTVKDGGVYANSRDVAAFFGKAHKDVLRSIDGLGCSPEFNERNFSPVEYVDAKGEARRAYDMTKDGFTFLVMGFTGRDAARFKEAYIQRFNEMESALRRQPVAPASAVDLENPDHLRSLLLQHTTKRIEAERALAVAAPKAETLDRIVADDRTFCLSDAAKILELGPKALIGWMAANKWLFRRPGTGAWVPFREKEESGHLALKVLYQYTSDGGERVREQTLVTTRGLARLSGLVPGACRSRQASRDLLDWKPERGVLRQ